MIENAKREAVQDSTADRGKDDLVQLWVMPQLVKDGVDLADE